MLQFILYLSFSLSNFSNIASLVTYSESNNNIFAVSNLKNDKGGKSHGLYQFNSVIYKKWLDTLPTGLKNQLVKNGYKKTLASCNIVQLATVAYYQHLYSYNTYYKPVVKAYKKKFDNNNINDNHLKLLYSLAVQHSPKGYKAVINGSDGTIEDIQQKRKDYVQKLNIDNKIKKAIYKRYNRELQVLNS